jgi:hypothetical protein
MVNDTCPINWANPYLQDAADYLNGIGPVGLDWHPNDAAGTKGTTQPSQTDDSTAPAEATGDFSRMDRGQGG